MSLFQRSISRPSRSRNAWRFFSNAGRSSDERRESPSTMFCVMMGARPGSSEKWGLPSGCTSPIERWTRVEGTSSRGMPREISIRPAAPRTMFGLFAPRTATSAHISSSAPFSISASARLSFSIMLGRTSASWKFCVPRVSASTSTRSPPTASVSDLRSGVVATTRSFFAACTPGASRASVITIAPTTRRGRLMFKPPCALEWVSGVGAQNERALEEHLVHVPGAAAVGVEAVSMIAVGVFIREPEAQELRRPERDVGLDRALAPRVDGELGPVVADAARPATEGLHLETGVPAEAILLALLDQIDRVVAGEAPREPCQIDGGIGHDRILGAPLGETLPAEKVAEHVGPIDPRQIVLVDHVRVAEAVPHLAELGLGAKRQREHGHARLGEVHGGLGASHAFARLDADLGVGVGVDLAEQ